jgi:hypothetical protein
MENAKINKKLNKQSEILAVEIDNFIKINKLFETVYKAAGGILALITLLDYIGYISYIFLNFYYKYL